MSGSVSPQLAAAIQLQPGQAAIGPAGGGPAYAFAMLLGTLFQNVGDAAPVAADTSPIGALGPAAISRAAIPGAAIPEAGIPGPGIPGPGIPGAAIPGAGIPGAEPGVALSLVPVQANTAGTAAGRESQKDRPSTMKGRLHAKEGGGGPDQYQSSPVGSDAALVVLFPAPSVQTAMPLSPANGASPAADTSVAATPGAATSVAGTSDAGTPVFGAGPKPGGHAAIQPALAAEDPAQQARIGAGAAASPSPVAGAVKPPAASDVALSSLGLPSSLPPPDPTVPGIAPVGRPSQTRPAPVADQVAPAIIGIMTSPDGGQTMTIRLDPAELGVVHIRVHQTESGVAQVDIQAARPETLQLLQRDQPRLQQALDQAGVPADGRSVTFQMSSPDQTGVGASRSGSMSMGLGSSGQGGQNGGFERSDSGGRQHGSGADADHRRPAVRWFHAGLDITA